MSSRQNLSPPKDSSRLWGLASASYCYIVRDKARIKTLFERIILVQVPRIKYPNSEKGVEGEEEEGLGWGWTEVAVLGYWCGERIFVLL